MNKKISYFVIIPLLIGSFYIFTKNRDIQCYKPLAGWSVPADKIPHLVPTMEIYLQKNGIVKWNNKEVSDTKFVEIMKAATELDPFPFMIFNYDKDIECDRLNFIRKKMEQSLNCAEGYCGEGTRWEHDDGMPDPRKR
jgi:hypothetical protein